MKRYWLSLLIGVLIITGLGMYYTANAINTLPDFVLEKVTGKEEEGKSILLGGRYEGRLKSIEMSVDQAGSTYVGSHPLFDDILNREFYNYYKVETDALINNYKGFMRGKGDITALLNHNDYLIYADVSSYREKNAYIQITTLEKQSGVGKKFKVDIPDGESIRWISVHDVQLTDSEIHILANPSRMGPNNGKQVIRYYDYVVNLESGALVRTVQLEVPVKLGSNERLEYSFYHPNDNVTQQEQYFMLQVRHSRGTDNNNGRSSTLLSRQLWYYSYQSQKILPIKESLVHWNNENRATDPEQLDDYSTLTLEDNKVSGANVEESSLSLWAFNLDTGQALKRTGTIYAKDYDAVKFHSARTRGDKVYVLAYKWKDPWVDPIVLVFDIHNGTLLYKGEVTEKGSNSKDKNDLNIYALHLKS
ncbi:hypothetical protein SY83_07760 [Paenibacillus swuensis]|uniref:Uncharacterized protein n=1 Tax=Paenibacillus swuensis TaxID=1178515 RepID=A0A172THC7_9BACL|nr:hypothetical protein [Paenibacillus swuensis]ANE46183.1 hypothetical protein SY83_07760 [Paenibacillus swuensis]